MCYKSIRTLFTLILFSLTLIACTSEESGDTTKFDEDNTVTIKTVPVDSQSDVPPNTKLISVAFSNPVNPDSVTLDKFTFNPQTSISIDKSLLVSRQVLFITVHDEFVAGTNYSATLSGVETIDGEPVSDLIWEFTTASINDVAPPTAPANLRVDGSVQANSIPLRWNASTDNAVLSGYQVLRDGVQISFVTNTNFTDTSLSAGQNYQYQIIAIDASQNQSVSNILSVMTVAQSNVPGLVGQTLSTAQQAITNAGLNIGNITTVASNSVALGNIISQNPAAGSLVNAGTLVSFVVSAGDSSVNVPSVIGQTQTNAQSSITALGLTVGNVSNASSSSVTTGNIISQNPVSGTSVATGSSVSLVVSSGAASITVPNVVGQTQSSAQTAITSAGLISGTISNASSSSVSAGNVISQNPVSGSSVVASSPVSLVISSGAASITVPNVVGQTQSSAQTAITSAGLISGTISNASSNSVSAGNVISQNPVSGSSVATSSPVSLVISSGPITAFNSYYISPTGNDNNTGSSSNSPWKTFRHAFENVMNPGDELILLDGDYTEATTGILRDDGNYGAPLPNNNSSSILSGQSRSNPTRVRSENPGTVTIIGPSGISPLFMGRSTRKDSFIEVQGITFIGGGDLYNTSYVSIKNSGFNGAFQIGTNDHYQGNDFNLIEDVWIWAKDTRIIAMNYRSHNNVWRRVLVRSEGCDLAGCEDAPKADPSVGITVYDSQNVSMQNIIVIDRLLNNDVPYADFATAQHTSASDADGNGTDYFLGNNEWLGALSINSQDASMMFEADNVMSGSSPIWTIKDFVSVGSNETGVNIGNTPSNYTSAGSPPSIIENTTVIITSANNDVSGIRVDPMQSSVLVKNSLAIGATRTGFNVISSTVENSLNYSVSTTEGDFDTSSACTGCQVLVNNPTSDGSILYPIRVETGSTVESAISNINSGANISYRYGVNGSIKGDTDYNTISDEPLWPWPNEDRIKKEMCNDTGITRGFCSNNLQLDASTPLTLSSYIWEYLGNQIPATIYGGNTDNDCTRNDIHCVDDTFGSTQEFSTIQDAVDIVAAGETVLVHQGTYEGFKISTSGTANMNVLVKAIDNNVFITSANSRSGGDNVYLSSVDYVTIDGFNISNAAAYCIGGHDATATNPMIGVTIRNNIVSNCSSSNIYMSHTADSLIENNISYNSVNSHGIYLSNAGSINTTLKNNTTFGNAKNGIHFNGDARYGGDGLHHGLLVEGNIIYGNVANGIDGDGVYDSTFLNNVIYKNGRYGIRIFKIDASAGAARLNYINNTIVSNASMAIKMTDDIGGHTFFNNIMVDNSGGCISVEDSNVASDNNIYSLNCTFEGDTGNLYGMSSITSNLTALFNNASLDDYSLILGAPAVNYGLYSFNGIDAPLLDKSGNSRSGAPDAGAYERQ